MSIASKTLIGLIALCLNLSWAQAMPSGAATAFDGQGRSSGERRIETPGQRGRENGTGASRPAQAGTRSSALQSWTSQAVNDVLTGKGRARSPSAERASRALRERAMGVVGGRGRR